jgi:hypothetical protein
MPRRLSRASVVRVFRPRSSVSSTGLSSHILIRCSTRRSTIRRATDLSSSECGMLPVVREVGVNDFRVAVKQLRLHLHYRLLGVSPGAVGVLLWWKVGLPGRRGCCHPRPPQIRTRGFPASGSSRKSFVPSGVAVDDPGQWQWMPGEERVEAVPCEQASSRSTFQPLVP